MTASITRVIRFTIFTFGLVAFANLAMADEFTEALEAASEAYADGDIDGASEELAYASQLLQRMKADQFAPLLPEALDGWNLDVDVEATAAMGMFGGGTTATGEYSNGSERFKITMMADNPSVMSMAGMLSNPQMMASMGEIIRINRQSFVDQDGEITGIVNGRILIQASGSAAREDIVAHLETMNFRAMD